MAKKIEFLDFVNSNNPEGDIAKKKEEEKKKEPVKPKRPNKRAIKTTGPHIETPLEKRTKLPTFTEKYEESLKRQLFEEDLARMTANKTNEDEESAYYEAERTIYHHKRDGDWDVPIDEEIKYFDPELSYEITGYRPINMYQSLDFDPLPFMETGRIYEETGNYTEYPAKTKPYNDF